MIPAFAPQVHNFVHPDDEKPEEVSPVVFVEATEEKEVTDVAAKIAAAEKAVGSTVKVKVVSPFRIVHEGVAYIDGDVIEAPHDEDASLWLKSGWVELVPEKEK